MADVCKPRWDIKPEDIRDSCVADKYRAMLRRAKSQMDLRTKGHGYFTKIAHMQNLYDTRDGQFSEGTTQAIKRKIRSETIQRVPDGELITQFDKNSIEQAEIDFIFQNKVLTSEYDGKDMLKNLWRTFDASYDYGYGCVRTGFEKDLDGDIRVTYKLIQWNDVLPAPDCDYIEEAEWYLIREYISYSELKNLINYETDTIKDKTYNEKTVKYLIDNHAPTAPDVRSVPLADKKNGVVKNDSVEVYTLYKRGMKTFKTFVPSVSAILREVDNYDPRKDVPLHFLILEPDPEFPLGCSSIMYTLAQQQFADAFQTSAYQQLLLSTNPPLMTFGNLTNAKIRMKARAIWNMGTNPNNKVEKYPVETTTITQYNPIKQSVQADMMKNLNITEQTVASDAHVMTYSGTPQGVEQQRRDKTTTVNQYQKRLEVFFSEWSNHALRSYINAISGKLELTVDETTRRKIWDVEKSQSDTDPLTGEPLVKSIIDKNKITIDFDILKEDLGLLQFTVRTGSFIEAERDVEREHIQNLIVPVSQMIPAIDEENKTAFTNVIMQLVSRLCELSDIDISASTSKPLNDKLLMQSMQATMEQVMAQQQQLDNITQMLSGQMPGQQGLEQQGLEQQAPQGLPQSAPEGAPLPQSASEGTPDIPLPPLPESGPQDAAQNPVGAAPMGSVQESTEAPASPYRLV